MKPSVQSFDIFDTIIGRHVADPKDVFGIVEKNTGFSSFRDKRLHAQSRSNHTWDNIYAVMKTDQMKTYAC